PESQDIVIQRHLVAARTRLKARNKGQLSVGPQTEIPVPGRPRRECVASEKGYEPTDATKTVRRSSRVLRPGAPASAHSPSLRHRRPPGRESVGRTLERRTRYPTLDAIRARCLHLSTLCPS